MKQKKQFRKLTDEELKQVTGGKEKTDPECITYKYTAAVQNNSK